MASTDTSQSITLRLLLSTCGKLPANIQRLTKMGLAHVETTGNGYNHCPPAFCLFTTCLLATIAARGHIRSCV